MKKETSRILDNTREALRGMKLGLDNFRGEDIENKQMNIGNFVRMGRCVTFYLQNLRHIEPDFDNWYNIYQKEMKSDPLLQYFIQLRNKIEKEGETSTGLSVYIGHFDSSELQNIPKPENATSFTMCEGATGASYWLIPLPNGESEKYYVKMNDSIITSIIWPNAPNIHLGEKLETNEVGELGLLYYDYLSKMFQDARKKFN